MAEEVKAAVAESEGKNFIDAFIEEDIAEGGRFQGQQVHTRFPPEPNGYLHIGHCKALTIDFGTAERFGGLCNLRMDDTNPTKEDVEFVDAIKEDIHWLGFDWGDRFFYGSDYFEKDYEYAVELIKKGLAYVCDLTPEEAKEYRGDIGKPAVSPYRDRDVEENLDLFERMKNGEFPEGSRTLRAKIDLASGNFNMRDPVIYRIRYMHHHRQGDKWCIYPMYDFAHPIQDALEGITHSLCSLEFEAHRPLYDWVVNNVSVPNHPRQIEFARLGIDHTVMSKRKLRQLVEQNYVSGWDDPRMPTLCGLRRRLSQPFHPRFLRAHRRGEVRQHRRIRPARALPARGSERHGGADDGRPAPREARHHELSGRQDRDFRGRKQPCPSRAGHASRHVLPRGLDRGRGFPAGADPQVQAPVPQRPGVPPEGRVSHHLHRLQAGCRRQHRGDLRHL